MVKSLVLLLALSVCACARPAKGPRNDGTIIFHTLVVTQPEGAELRCNGSVLGRSGQPLDLDANSLGSSVSITASLPG